MKSKKTNGNHVANRLVVRTKEQYWNDYIIRGLSRKQSKQMIRSSILDAFQKEIFGLICMRCKVGDWKDIEETPENKRIVENATKQAQNKWISLCIMCAQYKETRDLIKPNDIMEISGERKMANA